MHRVTHSDMKISSPAFDDGKKIPARFSRDGDDRIPPLEIREVPRDAKSLVLIIDDPDAPGGTFTHCVAYDIETTTNLIDASLLPKLAIGTNSFGQALYGGPQPPDREHRYFFRLYALDARLGLEGSPERDTVEAAMRPHVMEEASLMGRFAPEDIPG